MRPVSDRRTEILKALAHPVRLSLVETLSDRRLCVNDLAGRFPVDRTTIAWARAETPETRHPAAISPATTALRVFVSAKDITFSLMRVLQSLEEIEHCIV